MENSLTQKEIEVLNDLRVIYKASKKLELQEEKAIWKDIIVERCKKFKLDVGYILLENPVWEMVEEKRIKLALHE